MPADNTNRSSQLSHAKQLWSLAGPLIFGQVAVVGMTVTDIYMAGQISADELAAVQLGGSIWAVINLIVIGIMLGNSPIIGNHWGRGIAIWCVSSFSSAVGRKYLGSNQSYCDWHYARQ